MTPCLFYKGASFYDDDDDGDEMTPSKSWDKTAAALTFFTHCTFILNLHVHMVVKLYHLMVSSIMLLQQLCTEQLPNYSFATFTYVNSYVKSINEHV